MIIIQQFVLVHCFLLMIVTSVVNICNLNYALGLLRSSPSTFIFTRSVFVPVPKHHHIPSEQFYNLHKMKTRSTSASSSVAAAGLVLNASTQLLSTNNPKNITGARTSSSEVDNSANVNQICRKRSHSQSKKQSTVDVHAVKSSILTSASTGSIDEIVSNDDIKILNNDNHIRMSNSNEKDDSESSLLFLKSFIFHNDIQYHYFTKQEASAIRLSLLQWYRQHRRKLPWRGDPSPWNGSTSNFTSSTKTIKNENSKAASKKNKQQQKSKIQQSSMKQFIIGKRINKEEIYSNQVKEIYSKKLIEQEKVEQQQQQQEEQSSSTSICYPITLYGVWVSEIMLQQTRVDAVIPYWVKWMTEFPTVYELANATCEQVNAVWAGLGFYRRARFLHDAAKIIVSNKYNGIIPSSSIELQKLPGIGRYTACAIASIVSNEQVAVVDGNVCRVLSRLRCINQSIKVPVLKDQYGWILAQQIIDSYDAKSNEDEGHCSGEVNQALMEIGATYCSPSGTGIDITDPLHNYYWSTRLGYAISQTSTKIIFQLLDERRRIDQSKGTSKWCQVCATNHNDNNDRSNSIEQLITSLHESISNNNNVNENDYDTCRKLGHEMFPLAPIKTAKRVEVYAVLALQATTSTIDNEEMEEEEEQQPNNRWLLMKRPDNGLLAGQWEFPSVCLWSSATQLNEEEEEEEDDDDETNKSKKKKKKQTKVSTAATKAATSSSKDPVAPTFTVNERQNATKILLRTLLNDTTNKKRTTTTNTTNIINSDLYKSIISSMKPITSSSSKQDLVPLEHIFSHVRHTMYVDYCNLCDDTSISNALFRSSPHQMMIKGREIRWMNESEMKLVGITAGVIKILTAINNTS